MTFSNYYDKIIGRKLKRSVAMREIIILACTECKHRNYNTEKNKKNNPERIEIKKYCKWCNKETVHKETK